MKTSFPWSVACALAVLTCGETAFAVSSAELYSSQSYQYGKFEARVRFAPGSGVVGSFFLWKDGSELAGTFWNELDFEKIQADCHLVTNAFFGDPEVTHPQTPTLSQDLCGEYHTYRYEWTPEYIAWFVDDVEIRRDTGATAAAFAENATEGMQIRFNIWPGNASFGGAFDPGILPVYQYIDWIEYSAYANGAFELQWREDFDAPTLPSGWLLGSWGSPKNLSTHAPQNVGIVDGYAVLALTADDATGVEGASPEGPSPALTTATSSTSTTSTMNTFGTYPNRDSSSCSISKGRRGGNALSLTLMLGVAVFGVSRRLKGSAPTQRRGLTGKQAR